MTIFKDSIPAGYDNDHQWIQFYGELEGCNCANCVAKVSICSICGFIKSYNSYNNILYFMSIKDYDYNILRGITYDEMIMTCDEVIMRNILL
jgi:hypothetical protein